MMKTEDQPKIYTEKEVKALLALQILECVDSFKESESLGHYYHKDAYNSILNAPKPPLK